MTNRDEFHIWAMQERFRAEVDDQVVWLAPIEYVIVRKLDFYREGSSEKHLRDIRAMLDVSGDRVRADVLKRWITRYGLEAQWELASREPGR